MKIVTRDYKNIINVEMMDDISVVKYGGAFEVWITRARGENEYNMTLLSSTESECIDLIKSIVTAIQNDESIYII